MREFHDFASDKNWGEPIQHTSNWETCDYTMVASTPILPPKVIKKLT
jgi:hypothetical protein